jgi:hypothetical protein
MSSTAVLGFIKDIAAKNVAAVQDRLKSTPTQGPNQRFTDPKEQGLTYTLLHKAVEVCSPEIVSALLAAGASVNAADSRGRTSLHWLASSSHEGALSLAGKFSVFDIKFMKGCCPIPSSCMKVSCLKVEKRLAAVSNQY